MANLSNSTSRFEFDTDVWPTFDENIYYTTIESCNDGDGRYDEYAGEFADDDDYGCDCDDDDENKMMMMMRMK